MDADAEFLRRLQHGLQPHVASFGKQVEMVVGRRAAGQQQLRDADLGSRLDGVVIDVLPALVQLGQPSEQRRVLNGLQTACECLVQVVVRVDQAGDDQVSVRVDRLIRLPRFDGAGRLDRRDHVAVDQNVMIAEHLRLAIDASDDCGVAYECGHFSTPMSSFHSSGWSRTKSAIILMHSASSKSKTLMPRNSISARSPGKLRLSPTMTVPMPN